MSLPRSFLIQTAQCTLQDASLLSRPRLEQMYLFPKSVSKLHFKYVDTVEAVNPESFFCNFDISEETSSTNVVFPGDST